MINTTILLGGGASAAEGAPVQNLLFKQYFKALRETKNYSDCKRVGELCAYFKQLFFIDVLHDDLDTIEFPTFEEAIGLLDLAVRKRQSFKDFDLENIAKNSNRIGFIRQYLVLLMAEVLADKTAAVKGLHRVLVDRLNKLGCLADTVFLSTNYDVLIDQTLIDRNEITVDYGIDFANYRRPACSVQQNKPIVNLYKVHGSLNWSYCPTCNTVELINCRQGLRRLHTEPLQALCAICQSIKIPVIVPPTFFKDMSNNFINIVWHKTEACLRNTGHIVFCGYSFPDADMHIKYLLKRIQTNRTDRLRITVINNYPGKKQDKIDEEQKRYIRFLGTDIRYTDNTFADFCRHPENFL